MLNKNKYNYNSKKADPTYTVHLFFDRGKLKCDVVAELLYIKHR